MTASRFYDTSDPDGPSLLAEYRGIRPGDRVSYDNPQSPSIGGSLIVTELIDFGEDGTLEVLAVLNDGEWEVSAGNLRKLEEGQ